MKESTCEAATTTSWGNHDVALLPPEILDLIVGHLHDETATLRKCCLVSRSWIPQTQIHLFDRVEFRSSGPTLESWMKTFPDPSNSARAVFAFLIATRTLSRLRIAVPGFTPSTISRICKWRPLGMIRTSSLSLNYTDYPPPFDPSIFSTLTPRSQRFLPSFAPFPFSKIWR